MTVTQLDATLLIDDGQGGTRPLSVNDFKTDRTGAATHADINGLAFALTDSGSGTYGYDSDTVTRDAVVPPTARVKRVSVIADELEDATVRIAGGPVITVRAGGAFDEQIPGETPAGAAVVIGGTVSSFYVAWVV